MEKCYHCDRNVDKTEIVQIVNYEGNPEGHEHAESLCADCRDETIICNGCDRESFDPDFVGEFDCLACEEDDGEEGE